MGSFPQVGWEGGWIQTKGSQGTLQEWESGVCLSWHRGPTPWPFISNFSVFFCVGVPTVDPCLIVMPPCMGEADRFSLEALRHIHKQLDDDNDGGIEVNESVEVSLIYMYDLEPQENSNSFQSFYYFRWETCTEK